MHGLFREVLSGYFNSGGEVTGFTDTEHNTCGNKEVDTGNGDGSGNSSGSRNHFSSIVNAYYMFGSPTADGMEAGTHGPDEDSPKISFLGAHPVDEASGKKVGYGVYK